LKVEATTESNMSSGGGRKRTPSYKQAVVDRGKGPRSRVFKGPMTRTLGSEPRKQQERSWDKNETMEEVAKETQNEKHETGKVNGMEEHNPCKPKTILIAKVLLEDSQTQLYMDQMKMHVLTYKFMGLWPTERTL
jgi:hypothetical protein